MKCSLCDAPLDEHSAIFLTALNTPCEEPRCRDCYERAIRHPTGREMSEHSSRSPFSVDLEYHGFNWDEGYDPIGGGER